MQLKEYKTMEAEYAGGITLQFKFENGYGASVVKHDFSYGGQDGLWEVAVLDEDLQICYHTPITQDVIGYQTWKQVEKICEEIQSL
mgnify:CR=1 FL=1|jgi:hypothetical protein